jgi:zinc transport system permease protein
MGFFEALSQFGFLQNALIAGLLASVACGVTGTLIVARRLIYIAAGIAHSVLGGMGAARYLSASFGLDWLQPLHGAIVAAVLAAVLIGLVSLKAREREDTIISALWAVGMAGGILFLTFTPGYNEDLMSYLIGNVLMVSSGDLWLLVVLDLVILGVVYRYYNQFTGLCLDEEFARVRGLNVQSLFILLLILIAVTVVLLVSVVGIILIIALLTIPVALAGHWVRTLGHTMVTAVVICAVVTTAGLAASYSLDLPTGPVVIIIAALLYLPAVALQALRHRLT